MTQQYKHLWELFQKLRRRGFLLGIDDYQALKQSLQVGFGWSSRQALRDLCNSLWAKSRLEQEILTTLFEQFVPENEDWLLSNLPIKTESASNTEQKTESSLINVSTLQQQKIIPKIEPLTSLPEITLQDVQLSERRFIFAPQFPLTYREVAQAWRRLRRPVQVGSQKEVDLEATITLRCHSGVAAPVVFKPRRRNTVRLLLLVDRQGSMTPFHRFCDHIYKSIQQAGRIEETAIYYFHNILSEGSEQQVLKQLSNQLFPVLDSILPQIKPLLTGYLYKDPDLLIPVSIGEIISKNATDSFVVIISDAGAGRNRYNLTRLLNVISFIKALRAYTLHYIWLNPLPKTYWHNKNNTAFQIARHLPMFYIDKHGINQAVRVLRGHHYNLIKPL